MSTQQSLAQLQSILQKHRSNEIGYKDKIKQINLTRGKISDQLQILQQTYDKKLKALQQKLQILKTHNDTLIRQNVLYKSEIDTYQNRLVEKEKIIAMLLSQRKDLPVIVNSQRSKSQKTDSLNANEEQNKSFKKPILFKQDIQVPPQKFKQEITDQKINTQSVVRKVQIQPQNSIPPTSPLEIKRAVPLPKKKITSIPVVSQPKSIQPQPNNNQQQDKGEENYHPISNKPPKNTNRAKARKTPPINYPSPKFNSAQMPQQPAFQANNFFSNLGKQNHVEEVAGRKDNDKNLQYEQEQVDVALNEHKQQIKEELYDQHNNFVEEQIHQQPVYQYPQQNQQFFTNNHQQYQDNINTQQEPQINSVQSPITHQQNNFLSHFSNSYTQNSYEPYQPASKKVKKRARVESLQSEVSGNDFFSQLGKSQNENHHNLQIEQSSIDHIDRDNSLMSNEQPYFAQQAVVAKKAVKMPKKKGKRDQIKMMDPSCFE